MRRWIMNIYELHKDDVIIVKIDEKFLTQEDLLGIQRSYERIFSHNKVLVLPNDKVQLSIVKI